MLKNTVSYILLYVFLLPLILLSCTNENNENTDIYFYEDIILFVDSVNDFSAISDKDKDNTLIDIESSDNDNLQDSLTIDTRMTELEDINFDDNIVETYSDEIKLNDANNIDSNYEDIESDTDAGFSDIYTDICPEDMANIDEQFCIDLYEASLEEFIDNKWVEREPYYTVGNSIVRALPSRDRYPQAYISGQEAEIACKNAGKRLCTLNEWLKACKGPYNWIYPYGNQYEKDFCNDTYITGHHPLCDYFNLNPCDPSKLNYQQFNDPGINQMPDTISRGGEYSLCVSYYGVYDMHGNLHEWISDPEGTFKGGFYGDAKINGSGCNYTTTAHGFTYHDYSTGFRCCKNIK